MTKDEKKDGIGALWRMFRDPGRNQYQHINASTVARLSCLAIIGIWVMFLIETFLIPTVGESAARFWIDIARMVILISVLIAGASVTVTTTWFVNSTDEKNIDEREHHERNRATTISYRYLMGLLTFGMLIYNGALILSALTDDKFQWRPTLETTNYFFAAIFLTGILLPTFMMAVLARNETDSNDQS